MRVDPRPAMLIEGSLFMVWSMLCVLLGLILGALASLAIVWWLT